MVSNPASRTTPFKKDLVLIGSSTGGPKALTRLLSNIDDTFGCPIVITQHMPAPFIKGFVKQLNNECKLTVKLANEGELLVSNTVYVCSGQESLQVLSNQRHLSVSYGVCNVSDGFCPSVNMLFDSAAKIKGKHLLGIVLTGIGNDGARGAKALKEAGHEIWTQEESECVVYGMPKEVEKAGLSDRVLKIDDMAARLRSF